MRCTIRARRCSLRRTELIFRRNLIRCEPITSIPPTTEVQLPRSPAQSESGMAVTWNTSSYHGNDHTVPAWDRRYRPSPFTHSMPPCYSLTILLHRARSRTQCWLVERQVVCPCNQASVSLGIIWSHSGLALNQATPSDFKRPPGLSTSSSLRCAAPSLVSSVGPSPCDASSCPSDSCWLSFDPTIVT